MSEDRIYKDGDIVWVKLGNNWWPGEVTGVHRQPDGLIKHLKKKPYCVVKFFQEDAYEYVKSAKQIFPFQCNRKDEFIRKGNALYNAKNKFMEKFPSDVDFAERTSSKVIDDNTLIINDRPDSIVKAILGQTLTRSTGDYYDNDCSSSGAGYNKRRSGDSVTKILNITPQRTSSIRSATAAGGSKSSAPALVTRFSAASSADTNFYRCNLCDFSSQRQNVMIMHRRTHSSGNTSTAASTATTAKPAYAYNHSAIKTPKTTPTTAATSAATALSKRVNSFGTKVNNTSAPSSILSKANSSQKPESSPETAQSRQNDSRNRNTPVLKKVYLNSRERTPRSLVSRKLCAPIDADVADITLPDAAQSVSACSSPTKRLTLESDDEETVAIIDVTDNSLHRTNNATSYTAKGSVQMQHHKTTTNANTSATIATAAAEIQKRLLADWSDEERYDSDEAEVTKVHQGATKSDEAEQQSSQQPVRKANELNATTGGSIHNTATPTTSNRIRNIPKKDRRDIVLKEFISDFAIGHTSSSASMTPPIVSLDSTNSNSSSDSVVIVQEETIVIDEDAIELQEKRKQRSSRRLTAVNDRKEEMREGVQMIQLMESIPSPSVSPTPAAAVATDLVRHNEIIEQTHIDDNNMQKSVEAVEIMETIEILHEDDNISKSIVEVVEIVDDENVSKTTDTADLKEIMPNNEYVIKGVTKETVTKEAQVSGENAAPDEAVDSIQTVILSPNVAAKQTNVRASCFDFREEDEDESNAEHDVLMSIANYKKKYLSPNKPQTQESTLNYEAADENTRRKSKEKPPSAPEAVEQKDQQLSDEIDKLLAQTTPAVVDVNVMTIVPVRSSLDGKMSTCSEVPVKGLPIKERGKRIFKSRIQSRVVEERLEEPKPLTVPETRNNVIDAERAHEDNGKLQDKVAEPTVTTVYINNGVSCAIRKRSSATDNIDKDASDKDVLNGTNLAVEVEPQLKKDEEIVEKVPVYVSPSEANDEEQITRTTSKVVATLVSEVETQSAADEMTTEMNSTQKELAAETEQIVVTTLEESTENLSAAIEEEPTVKEDNVDEVLAVALEATHTEVEAAMPYQQSNTVEDETETANEKAKKSNAPDVEQLPIFEVERRSVTPSETIDKHSEVASDVNNSLMSEILTTKAMHAEIIANSNEDSQHEIKGHGDDTHISNETPSRYTSPTDENSSAGISDAGAEFGSPTSMLDDERLPLMVSSDLATPTDGLIEAQCSPVVAQAVVEPMEVILESFDKHEQHENRTDATICENENADKTCVEPRTATPEIALITKESHEGQITREPEDTIVVKEGEQQELTSIEQQTDIDRGKTDVEADAEECIASEGTIATSPVDVPATEMLICNAETEETENVKETQRTNEEPNDVANDNKPMEVNEEINVENDNQREVKSSKETFVAIDDKQKQTADEQIDTESDSKVMQCNTEVNIEAAREETPTNKAIVIASESAEKQTNEEIIATADGKNIHKIEARKSIDVEHAAAPMSATAAQQSVKRSKGNDAAVQQVQYDAETPLNDSDDDDGIESPPHEPLSGNELDNVAPPAQKSRTTKPKRGARRKETLAIVVESPPTESKPAVVEKKEVSANKPATRVKLSLAEITRIATEYGYEDGAGKRVTRASAQQTKSYTLNVHGYMKDLELSKLYNTKETPKIKDTTIRRNSRKSKNSPTTETENEEQSCAVAAIATAEVQNAEPDMSMRESKKRTKVTEPESAELSAASPETANVHDIETVINAEIVQKERPEISGIIERDPLEITAEMQSPEEETVVAERQTRKRRSCIKITPRRSPSSRMLGASIKGKLNEQQPREQSKNESNIEQTNVNVPEHEHEYVPQKKKLLEDVNVDGDNAKAKKAKVEKNKTSECGESVKINTTEAEVETETEAATARTTTAAAVAALNAAATVAAVDSDNLRKAENANSTETETQLKSVVELVEAEQINQLVTAEAVAKFDAAVPNNELTNPSKTQESPTPAITTTAQLTHTATTAATATVSEIRSFRPRRKTIALEIDSELQHQQQAVGSTGAGTATTTATSIAATSNTNGPSAMRLTPPKTNAACMGRAPSPSSNSQSLEKVRINVDVANPLSSQIANILASGGSGGHQQQAAGINVTLTKSATMKRKKSIEDVIPSFIIERPTMGASGGGGGHTQQSQLDMVEKDAVVHVQTMCPQVQITRKEKLIEAEAINTNQTSQFAKKGAKIAVSTDVVDVTDAAANAMFDISNMPVILSNDQILHENVHYVISSAATANAVVVPPPAALVETTAVSCSGGGSGNSSSVLSDGPKILQQQIIQPAHRSTPPPYLHAQRQRSLNQQQQPLQLQTNNMHTQMGIDSRGNKYVIIKTPPADLVLQQPVPSLQHLQQTQTQLQPPPLAAPKATGVGNFNIGSNVTLLPASEPNVSQSAPPPQVQSQLKTKSPAAAATGGRKQAGNIIALPSSVTMKSQQHTHIEDAPADVKKVAQQQLQTPSGKASRRQSINVRKTQASAQSQAQSQSQPQLQYQFKSKQPQPMPVQQRRLTAAPVERQGNANRGFSRRLSCADTSVTPAKVPRTIVSGAAFRGDEVALAAEQQLLQLQEQRRKVQSAPTTPITSVPPPLHPLHSRKPRHTAQRGNGKKRPSAEMDTMQQQQQRMVELEQQQQVNISALQQIVSQPPPLTQVGGPLFTTQLTQIAAPPLVQIIAPPLSEVAATSLNAAAVVTPLTQMAASPLVQVTGPLLAQSAAAPLIQVTAPPLVQVATSLPHQQEQVVDSPTISEEQLAQLEQFSLEDMKNVVAVRAGPIPGYPDIFVLYKLVEDSVTMFQQGPYYLNHDLNQLVQVPAEALEGIELIVDHPSPEDIVNLLQQAQGTQFDTLETVEANSPTPFICLGSPDDEESATGTIISEEDIEEQMDSPEIVGDAQVPADSDSENSPGNYILLTIGDQQVGCKVDELAQLLANSDDPHIITINGTPFVLSDDIINALRIHTDEQQRQHHLQVAEAAAAASMAANVQQLSDQSGAADIIAVALAGTELYGNEVLEIETSQALQLMGADGSIVFQPQVLPPAHLTPPITAHTSETNALLNQTPIMSTLEKPSTGVTACHGPTLDDSLAVIGLTTHPSSVPTSLELPITVTNPAIAPKVTMATSHADMMQFQPPRSVCAAIASETRIYNEPGS